jgi:ribonuclease PH
VYALVLENDGSALAAAITCAGLALADASVPMYDLVVAATLVCRARVFSLVYLTYLSLTERNVVSNPILCVFVFL